MPMVNSPNIVLVIGALLVLGGVLGCIVGLKAGAESWRVAGLAIAGTSGSAVGGAIIWLATSSTLLTALAGLVFGYLAIVVTSGSMDKP